MPYKPKYCCQCGEKIDRIDWKPWTSRRFCELCETEFGIYEWLSRGLFGIGLLFGLFGIGSYLQKDDKPLNVASKQIVNVVPNTKSAVLEQTNASRLLTNNAVQPLEQSGNSAAQIKSQGGTKASELKTKQTESSENEPSEESYFCGATTKKGTMCSHRVKGGGRCWQHVGQPAKLPQHKLKL
ncbi:MAG: hypothetical protein M3367_04955 [Acidobacteriota bacterium]|nr:hypothetical protein [Acidobacteriota bacterium]